VLLGSVVVGHSMESALYAFLNGYYHIQSSDFQPLFFEETSDFRLWGSNNKKHIWQKVKTCMGLLSRSIDYPEVGQIRVSENTIKIFSDNLLAEYEFGECFIYEVLNVSHENEVAEIAPEIFKVVDDFTVSRLGRSLFHIDPIYTEDSLLSEVYFYNSMRVDGSKTVTDIATVSYLSKEQLYSFDYSDTIASFKLRSHLSSWGYLGLKDKGKYKNGSLIYKKPILDHIKRHTIPVDKNKYKDTKKVKFINFTTEELFHAPST